MIMEKQFVYHASIIANLAEIIRNVIVVQMVLIELVIYVIAFLAFLKTIINAEAAKNNVRPVLFLIHVCHVSKVRIDLDLNVIV